MKILILNLKIKYLKNWKIKIYFSFEKLNFLCYNIIFYTSSFHPFIEPFQVMAYVWNPNSLRITFNHYNKVYFLQHGLDVKSSLHWISMDGINSSISSNYIKSNNSNYKIPKFNVKFLLMKHLDRTTRRPPLILITHFTWSTIFI